MITILVRFGKGRPIDSKHFLPMRILCPNVVFLKYLKSLEIEGLIDTETVNSITGRGRTQNITMSNSSPAELENRIEKVLSRY